MVGFARKINAEKPKFIINNIYQKNLLGDLR